MFEFILCSHTDLMNHSPLLTQYCIISNNFFTVGGVSFICQFKHFNNFFVNVFKPKRTTVEKASFVKLFTWKNAGPGWRKSASRCCGVKAISNRYLWNNFDFTKLNGLEQIETGSIAVKPSQNFSPFWCLTEGNGLKRIFYHVKIIVLFS